MLSTHNDVQPAQPLRLRYDENWDFAAPTMPTASKSGKATLLQLNQEYKKRNNNNNKSSKITTAQRPHDSELSDESETEVNESNLRDEIMRINIAETRSPSAKSSRSASSVPKSKRHFRTAKREEIYSPSEQETEDGYTSELGLDGELLLTHETYRTSRNNVNAQSDVHSMYSVESVASSRYSSNYPPSMRSASTSYAPHREDFHRQRKEAINRASMQENLWDDSASIGGLSNYSNFTNDTNLSKYRSQGFRTNSRRRSPTGSRITATGSSGFPHSPGRSPMESIRTPIPENVDSHNPADPITTGIDANSSAQTSRLSHESRSVISTQSQRSHYSRRESEQLKGRISKAETDSIGSASSIMMRPQSRISKSSGSKSMNTTDPDDEICKFYHSCIG